MDNTIYFKFYSKICWSLCIKRSLPKATTGYMYVLKMQIQMKILHVGAFFGTREDCVTNPNNFKSKGAQQYEFKKIN